MFLSGKGSSTQPSAFLQSVTLRVWGTTGTSKIKLTHEILSAMSFGIVCISNVGMVMQHGPYAALTFAS